MKTQILTASDLEIAADALKEEALVAFATETVYGLGALIFREKAIQKIFTVKNRPSDNPLIAHVSRLEQVLQIAEDLPSRFERLTQAFWPGPLTLIVKKKTEVPFFVTRGLDSIAIRMPEHTLARSLIDLVNQPLVAPSANLSGKPSPTSAADVLEDLDGKIPYILDGGECKFGIESTVLSLLEDRPVLFRPGAITQEEIEEVLKEKVFLADKEAPTLSPGMKYRHYAPEAKVRLIFKKEELKPPFFKPDAKTLYALLRDADRKGYKRIDLYCDETVQKDAALMNRLLRASGEIR